MTNLQSISSSSIHSEDRAHEADHPTSQLAKFGIEQPLKLDCGIDLAPFQIAYKTYGELNADKSNTILICHALTLDQHVSFFFNDTATTEFYTLSLHDALPLDTSASASGSRSTVARSISTSEAGRSA